MNQNPLTASFDPLVTNKTLDQNDSMNYSRNVHQHLSKDEESARNLAIFLKQQNRQNQQQIDALHNKKNFVCKDWRTFQEQKESFDNREKVVPIHH